MNNPDFHSGKDVWDKLEILARPMQALLAAISIAAVGYYISIQIGEAPPIRGGHEEIGSSNVAEQAYQLAEQAIAEINGLKSAVSKPDAHLDEGKALRIELEQIRSAMGQLSEQTKGLRQSINPIKPEEVLTIARLKDEVESLAVEVQALEAKLETRNNEFRQAVRREIDATSGATTLIIVAIIPLILNLLYSLWKDRKTDAKTR